MYLFGHLGIGLKLASPFTGPEKKGLPRRFILLGAILPDLIDKPLYYGFALFTGRSGADIGLISGTRTFGHAAIMTISLAAVSAWRKSRLLAAIALGMASHLLLDGLSDYLVQGPDKFSLEGLLWPFAGLHFPSYPFHSASEQLFRATQPYYLCAELIGLALLAWEAWKSRNRAGIITFLNERRLRRSKTDR